MMTRWGYPASARRIAVGAWLVTWSLAGMAQEPTREELDVLGARIGEVAQSAKSYQQVAGPAGGALSDDEASDRFQDAVYLSMIGNHESAAEAFFVLVATRSLESIGLQRDAEWYLAESLYASGNRDIAVARYQGIARVEGHPFREEAVRRLLEIYAGDADTTRFERLYQVEIVGRGVRPSDLILYSVGKAFWRRGDLARAKSYFQELLPESPFYPRAQYFVAAMLVQAGDVTAVDQALVIFQQLVDRAVVLPEDRSVQDLSRLAVARVAYERRDFDRALGLYQAIPEDSAFRADKLNEIAWTHIQRNDLPAARAAVEAFLEVFPNHQYAAELNLVRGHLLFELGDFEQALLAYDKVVDEYTPVRDRFQKLARATDRAEDYVHQVLDVERGTSTQAGSSETALPAYAISVMLADNDLSRALSLFRELERQETSITVSENLIQQIGAALGSSADSSGSVQGLRFSATDADLQGIGVGVDLLALEERWLKVVGVGDTGTLLDPLAQRRSAISAEVGRISAHLEGTRYELGAARAELRAHVRDLEDAQNRARSAEDALSRISAGVDVGEATTLRRMLAEATADLTRLEAAGGDARERLDTAAEELSAATEPLERELKVLMGDYAALRAPLGVDVEMDPTVARFDRLHATLVTALDRLRSVDVALAGGEGGQLLRIRDVWRRETDLVRLQRADLSQRFADADTVAGGLVRANFRKLSDVFARNVLGADMGAVNVYWSQLLVMAEQADALADQRKVAVEELERKYTFLEGKVSR